MHSSVIDLNKLLDLVRSRCVASVYEIAKELGISYGTAQWYVASLLRKGLAEDFKIGRKRYISVERSAYRCVKVQDVIDALKPFAQMRVSELDEPLAGLLESIVRLLAESGHPSTELRRGL